MTALRSQDWKAAALLALVVALLYLPFYSGRFTSTDELAVFEMTQSLFESGDLTVPEIQHTGLGPSGERFSLFAPGQSLLALPHYAIARGLKRILPATVVDDVRGRDIYVQGTNRFGGRLEIAVVGSFGLVATALLVAAYFLFQRDLGARPRTALLAAGLLASATYLGSLSSYFLRHPTETLFILVSLFALRRWHLQRERRWLWIATSCASAIVLLRVPSAVYGVAFGGALLTSGARRFGKASGRDTLLDVLAVAAPLLVALASHAALNHYRWGTLFASPMTAQSAILDHPLWLGASGLLFSPGVSLFAYSPLLLLSPWLLWSLRKREPLVVGTVVAVFACFVLFVGSYRHWPGLWTAPGPRYLYQSIPLLLLPLGPWLEGKPARRSWVWSLAIPGFLVQLGLLLTPWSATVAHMGYAAMGPEGPFLWSLASGPIPGTFETLFVRQEPGPWLWKLAAGWPGHPPAPLRAVGWLGAWFIAILPAVWALRKAVNAAETADLASEPPGRNE